MSEHTPFKDRNPAFWKNTIRAVEADPRDDLIVRGYSGLEHPVLGLGVDDKRGRVILISSEHDGRGAAMMQSDVQATLPDARVVVARPVLINLPPAIRMIVDVVGQSEIKMKDLASFINSGALSKDWMDRAFEPVTRTLKIAPISVLSQIVQMIQQLAMIDFSPARIPSDTAPGEMVNELLVNFERLTTSDPTRPDRDLGICPLPLFEFSEPQLETVASGSRVDDIAALLHEHDVFQFFFPAADQLALGLIDRGITDRAQVPTLISKAPELGHPLGTPELTSVGHNLMETVEALEDKGLVVDGELGVSITPSGTEVRANVKFKSKRRRVVEVVESRQCECRAKSGFPWQRRWRHALTRLCGVLPRSDCRGQTRFCRPEAPQLHERVVTKVVLTTKIDPSYDDLPEERYHFPRTYLRQVQAALNDWIIYYEPRRASADLSSRGGRQAYFATARISRIDAD